MKFVIALLLALVTQLGMAQSIVTPPSIHIIGDSLNYSNRPDGVPSPSEIMRFFGDDITCDCVSGMSHVLHDWRMYDGDADVVVIALLTNDAGVSELLGKQQQWLDIYLVAVEWSVKTLVGKGKRVIFVLPTIPAAHSWYSAQNSHLFRWFAAGVAKKHGAELLDMSTKNVPLGPDGLHYDNAGTLAYAKALHNHIHGK